MPKPTKVPRWPRFEGDPYAASSVTDAPGTLPSQAPYPTSQTATEFTTDLPQRQSPPVAKRRKRRRESLAADERRQTPTSLSPYDSSHTLMVSCNRHLVSESFLQIYHDVLENHLHCLLDEDVCPYKTWVSLRPQMLPNQREFPFPISHKPSIDSASTQKLPIATPSASKYSSSWSNQMYRRVNDLERAAQKVGLISLTRQESQTAARAMISTIMAYAAQWSQGKQRRERFTSDPDDPPEEDDTADVFEQHLQSALWEGAKQTVDASAHIESFKAIFAEIVFGFTQKPRLTVDPPDQPPLPAEGNFKGYFLNQVKGLLNEERSAFYLRSAIRKSYTLKLRFDSMLADHLQRPFGNTWLNEEQSGTVGLVYWFAVMIDTVLSSMNYLPTIIADEDCQHNNADTLETSKTPSTTVYWDLSTFAQDDPSHPSVYRWPCPPEDAFRAVTRAAAVKILLFRSVSYVQGALRRRSGCIDVEEKITNALKVCSYWNTTHGVLFRDFIDSYDTLPTRIRSWFPFVGIHWHLATQLLADLVDRVDEKGYGSEMGRLSRADAKITARMRKTSATELSELAWVTTPQQDDSGAAPYEHLPSFHFAVNEGPGLTEPWTLLLIKALSQATIFHLGVMEEEYQSQPPGETGGPGQETLQQVKACVRALWFIGRRSSSARNLSLLFVRWTNRIIRPQTQSSSSSSPSQVGWAAA